LPASDSKLYFTSAAVTGSPLLKRASGFRRKVIALRSGSMRISCASRPYIVRGSSAPSTVSGSSMKMAMPAGALPRMVK
jgi:hypothetical protein